jgi:hypothetical protein
MVMFFLVYMIIFRGYFVRCHKNWQEECINNPANISDNVSLPGQPKQLGCAPTVVNNVSQRKDLFDYCKYVATHHIPQGKDLPHFYWVGDKESQPGICLLGSKKINALRDNDWCRAKCHPFTCYFGKGGSRDFKITPWRLWFVILIFFLMNFLWCTNSFPLCFPCLWSADSLNATPLPCVIDLQRQWDNFSGCGTLPHYFVWLWTALIPAWISAYVTFVDGDFKAVMPKVDFNWSFFTVLFSDAKNIAISTLVIIMVLVIYIQRQAVYSALGIDDRYILHWKNLFGHQATQKDIVLQICVWKVLGNYDHDKQKDKGKDISVPLESPSFLCSRMRASHDTRPALDLGKESSLFIRIAYGHNEPLCGRVVRVPPSYGTDMTVTFKEIFRVNYDASQPVPDQLPLYIELCKQDVYGREDIGRVIIEPRRLQRILAKTLRDHTCAKDQAATMLGMAPLDTVASTSQPTPSPSRANETESLLTPNSPLPEERGFQVELFPAGGALEYAIAAVREGS